MTSVLEEPERRPRSRVAVREVLVRSMTWEAERVLSLDLVDPSGADLPPWTPGAHLDVDLGAPGERQNVERQYSLCGDPVDRCRWQVAVLHEEQGRGGSAHVHGVLRPGDVLAVRGPKNNFPLVPATEYLFVAGGIGITPILPMVAEVERAGLPWQLLYGGRRRASMAFLDRLAQLDRVTVWPQDERGPLDLDAGLAGLAGLGAGGAVFACGPEPLLGALEQRCTERGVALHLERFAAKPRLDPTPFGAFEVECRRSGRTFTVEPGESIVEAAERAGLTPAYSCLDGICGTCETAVLAGDPDHGDSILSDDEQQAGDTMMICVSRCRGERLVLDL